MKFILGAIFILSITSCKSSSDNIETTASETAQQVGDVMASVDEAGGSTGNVSMESSVRKTFARYAPDELKENFKAKLFLPEAQAVACNGTGNGMGVGFGGCTSQSLTRTYNNCSIGSAVLSGTVVITWAGTGVSTCGLSGAPGGGDNTISRSPSFTVEGRRGATLTVSKTGSYGQRLTWISGTSPKVFNLTNDGIKRKFVSPVGTTLFEHTTTITSPITVTGSPRSGRVLNGGTLRITNNATGGTCDFSPSNVTWPVATTCNCPTQGTWQGLCTDSSGTVSATLTLNGCGTGTYSEGNQAQSNVTLDRCGL